MLDNSLDIKERKERVRKYVEKSKEKFYIDKNRNVEQLEAFTERIKLLDSDIIDFEYPEMDPKKLIPSLYSDELDEEQYRIERDAFLEVYSKFEDLLERLLTEAEIEMRS